MTTTEKLLIPLLDGGDPFRREAFNAAYSRIDEAALPIEHAETKAHFSMWKKNTKYKKQDVVRTPTCPNWGFYLCTAAGTSGEEEPVGYGEGDVIEDGTCTWTLKLFGGSNKITGGITLWASGRTYKSDELVLYHRLMYRAKVEHKAEALFDDTKWQLLNTGYLPDWKTGMVYESNMLVRQGEKIYRCTTYHTSANFSGEKAKWEFVTGNSAQIYDWKVDASYEKDEIVRYAGFVYKTKQAHVSGAAFDTNLWEMLTTGYLPDWKSSAEYEQGMTVAQGGAIYRCKVKHTAGNFKTDKSKWEVILGKGNAVAEWKSGTEYEPGDTVFCDKLMYRCLLSHTAGEIFDETKWKLLNICYIPEWQTSAAYVENETVTRGSSLIRCKTGHTSTDFNSIERQNWEVIAGKGAVLPEWKAKTEYGIDEAVVYNDSIYRAVDAHASGDTFSGDMSPGNEKWRILGSGGSSGELKQITKLGVTAPKQVDIVISNTNTFSLPPAEVLKFALGPQDQVTTVCAFDNADADDFIVDGVSGEQSKYVSFDGTMKLNTEYTIAMSEPVVLEDWFMCESEEIDFAEYKKVEEVG